MKTFTTSLVTLGAVTLVGACFTNAASASVDEENSTDETKTVQELKLENAPVPMDEELEFGAEPLEHTTHAAAEAAESAACELGDEQALALTISMTWPEVSLSSGETPSPMTLSRYDTQEGLGDPENRAEGLWFHPGIGLWQMDSAGLGNDYTAFEAMDVEHTAGKVAPYIVGKYCDSVNEGASEADARAAAWSDWHACDDGDCESVYHRILNEGVTPVDSVDRYGGAEPRACEYEGEMVHCAFVDPANAQGADWWAAPDGGRSPISAPFYVLRLGEGDDSTELRYWLAEDSGAEEDVSAARAFGADARDSLVWATGAGLCDATAERGSC